MIPRAEHHCQQWLCPGTLPGQREKALEQNSEMLLHPSLSLQKAVDGVGSKQLKILRVQEFLWLNNWADKATDVALR